MWGRRAAPGPGPGCPPGPQNLLVPSGWWETGNVLVILPAFHPTAVLPGCPAKSWQDELLAWFHQVSSSLQDGPHSVCPTHPLPPARYHGPAQLLLPPHIPSIGTDKEQLSFPSLIQANNSSPIALTRSHTSGTETEGARLKTRRGKRWPDKYLFLLFCFNCGEVESHGH